MDEVVFTNFAASPLSFVIAQELNQWPITSFDNKQAGARSYIGIRMCFQNRNESSAD